MGNYDQFTDVAVFPDLCMDTMLPPGMLRNKSLGLDKSLMGLEMRGGGNTTTQVENKYDDQWIKDTFSDYTQKYKEYTAGQKAQDETIGQNIKNLTFLSAKKWDKEAGEAWAEDKLTNLGTKLTDNFNQQFADLNVGDIGGMQDYIDQIGDLSKYQGEMKGTLSDIQENYADKDYLEGALGSLETNLSTSFEDQLSGVQSELSGDISALGTDFASQLSESEKTGAQNLADVKAALESDYGSKITNLSDTFGTKLSDTAASLTDKFGQQYSSLSDQLAGAESDLAAHKSDTQSKFSDVASQYSGLSSDLADLGTDTASKFSQAYKDAQTMYDVIDDDISDLDIKFGTELGAAKDHMAAQLKSTDEALNKRLTDISKSMNYRMLGNTASGVKIRRSKGFNRGFTTRGTGQLGRKMKIGNLNL